MAIKEKTFIKLAEDNGGEEILAELAEGVSSSSLWLINLLKGDKTLQMSELAELGNKTILETIAVSEALWNAGIVDTVHACLAIGSLDNFQWSIHFVVDDAQQVADLLAKANHGVYPKSIIIIKNGVDGPNYKHLLGWLDPSDINISVIKNIWEEQSVFSQKTFGSDDIKGPIGSLKHLEKEAKEAQEKPDDFEEYADCLLLILDAARRSKQTLLDLLTTAYFKLQKNKKRKWPPINATNLDVDIRHI